MMRFAACHRSALSHIWLDAVKGNAAAQYNPLKTMGFGAQCCCCVVPESTISVTLLRCKENVCSLTTEPLGTALYN